MKETIEPENKTNNRQQKVQDSKRKSLRFWPSSSGWIAIFTGMLTLFTLLLYRGAERAEENRQRTTRAIVSFRGITPSLRKNISSDGKTWESVRVGFTFVNGGFTPTREMQYKINQQLFQGEPPQGFPFDDLDDNPPGVLALGPNAGARGYVNVPISRLLAAVSGERLYFWGWATYRDVFPSSPPRLTEFCTQAVNITFENLNNPTDPKGNVRFDIEPCAQHNCYDEDCTDYHARTRMQ